MKRRTTSPGIRRELRRRRTPEFHLLLSLMLGVVIYHSSTRPMWIPDLMLNIVSLPLRSAAAIRNAVTDFHREYLSDRDRVEEIRRLRRDNARLHTEVNRLNALIQAIRSYDALRQIGPLEEEVGEARVISAGRIISIDRGTSTSVRRNDSVLSGQGLVGRVTQCSLLVSQVTPISDPLSSVSVIDLRNGEHGILRGVGRGWLKLLYLPGSSTIRRGDLFVTDGRDRIFPAGITVGRTRFIDKDEFGTTARAEMAVNIGLLDYVRIVRKREAGP